MRRNVSAGDLALRAQPATPEAFAPFGKLLLSGGRALLGRRGRVLVALDERRPLPRRVTHLQRYPRAKRGYLAVGGVTMWVVVLGAGERPGGRPAAFLVPPGATVIIDEGIWHAGPVPLEDAIVCEMLEVIGTSDRFDRRGLPDLVDAIGVRVLLPAEQAAEEGARDLATSDTVLLDPALHGRLRLGLLALEDLDVGPAGEVEVQALERAAEELRGQWQEATDLVEIPGVAVGRELYDDLGIDMQRVPPRSEGLLDEVLRGRPIPSGDRLSAALDLCALRLRVPMAAYDAQGLTPRILARPGARDESYAGIGRRRVAVDGRPVLCDGEGPFGSPVGDSYRTRIGEGTRRALIVLYLPASADPGAVESLLEGVAKTISEHCGGRAVGQAVVG